MNIIHEYYSWYRKGIDMLVRLAEREELEEILGIYRYARKFMAEHGNPEQWGEVHPPVELIKDDIESGKCHVCVDDGRIQCVFYYTLGVDHTYDIIDGKWLNGAPYAVIHRIASAPDTKGAATYAINWAYERYPNLRIDTHDDNMPMQHLLAKLGFTYCGTIYLENGDPRRAYQKTAL